MKKMTMTQYWAEEARKLLVGKDVRAQWRLASHRARATRMLYKHSYLPSIAKSMDMDGCINITWIDATEVVRPLQIIADSIFGLFCGVAEDKLASRKAGMVLAAQNHARHPDPFEDFSDV